MSHFSSLDLCKPLLKAVAQEGYDTPTPIQAKAIPPAMAGRDLLGCAQTGTGKTAAFALPILHRLHIAAKGDQRNRGPVFPRALILSPTRELAGQIEESFETYGRHTRLRQTVIYGGVNQFHQVRRLRAGVDILVATPGRLIDLMEQGHVDLRHIEVFVLDEADRMLDMGFIHPIRRIASALPDKRQTLFFSATMPRNITKLAGSLLDRPVKVTVTPVVETTELIEQSVYMVPRQAKPALIEHLLVELGVERALVFTRTKHGADKLTRRLRHSGVMATAIHGNKSQNQRQHALDSFRSGRSRVLVATDVAARGLDVDGITHVFNFDLPNEPEAYVHRIGRTGRAGANGVAISFCDHDERIHLRAIERLTGTRLAAVSGPPSIEKFSEEDDTDSQPKRRGSSGPARAGQRPRTPEKGPKRSSRKERSHPHATRSNKRRPNGGGKGGGAKGGGRGRRRSA